MKRYALFLALFAYLAAPLFVLVGLAIARLFS